MVVIAVQVVVVVVVVLLLPGGALSSRVMAVGRVVCVNLKSCTHLANMFMKCGGKKALAQVGGPQPEGSPGCQVGEQIINWQKEALRRQLLWARQFDCPIIIHSRAAFDDCVEEIDRSGVNWERVVFHCFTEGVAQIKKLIERGGRASFTGILTFPKNDQLWDAVKYQGVEKLMLETDSPYLAPVPHRGKRNETAFINKVGEYACNLLNVDAVDKIWANSMNFYQLHI